MTREFRHGPNQQENVTLIEFSNLSERFRRPSLGMPSVFTTRFFFRENSFSTPHKRSGMAQKKAYPLWNSSQRQRLFAREKIKKKTRKKKKITKKYENFTFYDARFRCCSRRLMFHVPFHGKRIKSYAREQWNWVESSSTHSTTHNTASRPRKVMRGLPKRKLGLWVRYTTEQKERFQQPWKLGEALVCYCNDGISKSIYSTFSW